MQPVQPLAIRTLLPHRFKQRLPLATVNGSGPPTEVPIPGRLNVSVFSAMTALAIATSWSVKPRT